MVIIQLWIESGFEFDLLIRIQEGQENKKNRIQEVLEKKTQSGFKRARKKEQSGFKKARKKTSGFKKARKKKQSRFKKTRKKRKSIRIQEGQGKIYPDSKRPGKKKNNPYSRKAREKNNLDSRRPGKNKNNARKAGCSIWRLEASPGCIGESTTYRSLRRSLKKTYFFKFTVNRKFSPSF